MYDAGAFEISKIGCEVWSVYFHCPNCGRSDYALNVDKFNSSGYYKYGDQCCQKYQADSNTLLLLKNIGLRTTLYIERSNSEDKSRNYNGIIVLGVLPTLLGFVFQPLLLLGIPALIYAAIAYLIGCKK